MNTPIAQVTDSIGQLLGAFLTNLVSLLFWIGLFYIPTAFVVWRMSRAKREYDKEADDPFTDLPLRLPGESTRKAADEHWERAMEWCLLLLCSSGLFGFAVARMEAGQRPFGAVIFGLPVLALSVIAGSRVMKSLRLYWSYQLGFTGERVVAEELNQLLSQGWRIFHDVPFDRYNVDHVAVGPIGVFAVETKTRRKWKDRATVHPAHMVVWDGRQLTWPSGTRNDFGLVQAARNAQTLAEFLTKAVGEPVRCQPVLTLPGWWIEAKGRGSVIVASTKGLSKVLPKCGHAVLPPAQVQRIAYQLEQHCRRGLGETKAA